MHARGFREARQVKIYNCDVSDIFAHVELQSIRRALDTGGRVFAVRTEGVAGLAQWPTQPHTRFLDELSGRIRVIACLDQPPIVLSGETMPEFPNRHKVVERVRKRVREGENDDFFIVFGPEEDCRTAAEEIRIRFAEAIDGVPKETRQALFGGYTTFERILPGPDRMYPDTDSPPSRITPERVAAARSRLRPAPWERIARYLSWRVPEETAHYLLRRGGAEIVDEVVERTGVDGLVAAIEIGQRAKALAREGIPVKSLDAAAWTGIFDLLTDGRITREAVPQLATVMAKNPGVSAEEACRAEGLSALPKGEWMTQLSDLPLDDYRGASDDTEQKRLRFLAGRAMARLRGKAPAAEVVNYLRQKLASEVNQ
jgi:glutamyl-tRNA(Gln) amidotransferase subunit E